MDQVALARDYTHITTPNDVCISHNNLTSPTGLVLDINAKRLYISDTRMHRIIVLDEQDNMISSWGTFGIGENEFNTPTGLALSPRHDILIVVDTKNHRMQLFSTNYLHPFIKSIGKKGMCDGHFLYPQDVVCTKDDILLISDTGNDRIQAVTIDGEFLYSLGNEINGGFKNPRGIAMNSNNIVHIVDTDNHCIIRYFQEKSMGSWGKEGKEAGEFSSPSGLAMTSDDDIVVCDTGNARIQIFSMFGILAHIIPILHSSPIWITCSFSSIYVSTSTITSTTPVSALLQYPTCVRESVGCLGTLPAAFMEDFWSYLTLKDTFILDEVCLYLHTHGHRRRTAWTIWPLNPLRYQDALSYFIKSSNENGFRTVLSAWYGARFYFFHQVKLCHIVQMSFSDEQSADEKQATYLSLLGFIEAVQLEALEWNDHLFLSLPKNEKKMVKDVQENQCSGVATLQRHQNTQCNALLSRIQKLFPPI